MASTIKIGDIKPTKIIENNLTFGLSSMGSIEIIGNEAGKLTGKDAFLKILYL